MREGGRAQAREHSEKSLAVWPCALSVVPVQKVGTGKEIRIAKGTESVDR